MRWRLCGHLLALWVATTVSLALVNCPVGCCCPHGALVLCESLGLRSLPRSVPLSTSGLSMAHNHLCNVDHLLLPFSSLQELSLSHNQLPRFPKGLPPSLKALQLQENRITYLTASGVRQLVNLTRLDLEDNRIRAIQPGAFLSLEKLQVLNLKGNRLSRLPQSLPPSLVHLDLSTNCISSLHLPSLAALVNLQVLKINSNCLTSVPESAFEGLARLRTVELADNLWLCECDILYLYRWLLNGRLKMATDLVCTAPVHLAHRPLLTLSVMAICPWVLKPNDRPFLHEATVSYVPLEHHTVHSAATTMVTGAPSPSESRLSRSFYRSTTLVSKRKPKPAENHTRARHIAKKRAGSGPSSKHYNLEEISYEDCWTLNPTPVPTSPTDTSLPYEQPRCTVNSTGHYSTSNVTASELTSPIPPTNKAGLQHPIPFQPVRLRESAAVVTVLAILCVLVALVLLAVLLVLKKVLRRNQRVAPVQNS